MNSVTVDNVQGSTLPRIYTPPLVTGPPGPCGCGCALTPSTSYGFDVDEFARVVLRHPLDPWQRWLAIHAGELLPDGSPRFYQVLVLVARQNGKTELLVVLSLFWMYVDRWPMVLGTSTKLDYAKESWRKAVRLARRVPDLSAEIPARGGVRETNGEQELMIRYRIGAEDLEDEARYKIAAANAEGGRSLTVNRLILDELRQHHTYDAWDATEGATSAAAWSQIWAITNAGTDKSIVLNDLRAAALAFLGLDDQEQPIEPAGDDDLMLAEWSAPPNSDPEDLVALAAANPNLGRRKNARRLLAQARRAKARGGEKLTGFKTEHMCIRVRLMDPAIDPGAFARANVPGDLSAVRSRVAMVLDVAPDLLHATLYAAAVLPDGKVRVDFRAAWEGLGCTDKARRDLPGILASSRPQAFGWLPNGPAAALAASLADRRKAGQRARRNNWPPAGVAVSEIRAEVPAVCMGFAEGILSGRYVHSGDPLLTAQTHGAEKLWHGDVWVFSRRGEGHVDSVYAAAGCAHLAQILPPPVGRPRLVTVEPPY